MSRKRICFSSTILILLLTSLGAVAQQVDRYDLYVSDTTMNVTGKRVRAIAVNGQIPGPQLSFAEGDTAEIYVHNLMDVPTSFQWHGIILPDSQAGVPYLTTPPILPHTTHLYKFPIVQHGTYWYHSGYGYQDQIGTYGALILHRRHPDHSMPQYTVVLSDWTNESPEGVMRSLKTGTDWYEIKNGSMQSWGSALMKGYLPAKVEMEWHTMPLVDVSDVYYPAFLLNGKHERSLPGLKAGGRIRLRIINASASSYFRLQFAGGKLTVVANDGSDVVPVKVDRMLIAVGETYDVVVTIPKDKSYQFLATAEDRTGSASLWLGSGKKVYAPKPGRLNYFKGTQAMDRVMYSPGGMQNMKMSDQEDNIFTAMYPELNGKRAGTMDHHMSKMSGMRGMKGVKVMNMMMNSSPGGIVTLNYGMLRSPVKTSLPDRPMKTFRFNLTGDMYRYQWSINNKTLAQARPIAIRKGENIRVIIHNETMMRHPMDLDGMEFRLLNGHGDYDPMKSIVDVKPMETDTIEFTPPHTGAWLFHCHILYHRNSGMGRVFTVAPAVSSHIIAKAGDPPDPTADAFENGYREFAGIDNSWYPSASVSAQSNGFFPTIRAINQNYVFQFSGGADYRGDYQGTARFGRRFGTMQFLEAFVGVDFSRLGRLTGFASGSRKSQTLAIAGVRYLLPFFFQSDLRVDDTGHLTFQLSRDDFTVTSQLTMNGMWNTDGEYDVGMSYVLTKYFSLSADYDSDFGFGGGLTYTY